jgi:hypothetical protein
MHAYIQTYINSCMHAYTHTHTCAPAATSPQHTINIFVYMCTHTCIETQIYAHLHTERHPTECLWLQPARNMPSERDNLLYYTLKRSVPSLTCHQYTCTHAHTHTYTHTPTSKSWSSTRLQSIFLCICTHTYIHKCTHLNALGCNGPAPSNCCLAFTPSNSSCSKFAPEAYTCILLPPPI